MEEKMKERILSLFLALILVIGLLPQITIPASAADDVWNGEVDTTWYDASATSFTITSAMQLAGLAQIVNDTNENIAADSFSGKTITLGANIVLNNTSGWDSWSDSNAPTHAWTPIGSDGHPFRGKFDGGGHTVAGIYIYNTSASYQGLFGNLSSGTLQDVGVIKSYIYAAQYIGGVVGYSTSSTVSNCYNTGTVSGSKNVGGVAGSVASGTVSNCYNTGTISGGGMAGDMAGGVAGYVGGTVYNCYNAGKVTGSLTGSLIGENDSSSTVTNCYWLSPASGFGPGASGGNDSCSFSGSGTVWMLSDTNAILIGTASFSSVSTGENAALLDALNTWVDTIDYKTWKADSDGVNNGYPILDAGYQPKVTVANGYGENSDQLCIGATLTVSAKITSPATLSYQWEVSANGTTGWANATGDGNDTASYTVTSAEVGDYLRVKVTSSGSGNSGYSAASAQVPYTILLQATGASGTDAVSFSNTSAVTTTYAASGAVKLYYTLDNSGNQSNTLTYAGGTVTKVPAAGQGSSTYAVSGGDAADGVITLSAAFAHASSSGGGSDNDNSNDNDSDDTVTVPVSDNAGTVNLKASVSGSTATIAAFDAQLKEIASGAQTGVVKINASGTKADAVLVPAKLAAAANEASGSAGLEVDLPTGTVTLDKPALASVEGKGDVKISVKAVDNSKLSDTQKAALGAQAETAFVVDVNVYVNNTRTSTFGDGKITVSVPYILKSGENPDSITVWFLKDDGTIEPKTASYADGMVTFTTEHLSQYLIVDFPFTDVAESAWCYGSVAYAYDNGLFSGTSATTFSPNATANRQMIWMVLARMDGKAPANMAEAKAWAVENGISDGSNPTGTITRQQMAAILYRYAQFKGYDVSVGEDTNILSYDDALTISEYAIPALQWACGAGLMQGSGNNLMPFGNATRAQVATILQRFIQNLEK
jgi:hypothetical protein